MGHPQIGSPGKSDAVRPSSSAVSILALMRGPIPFPRAVEVSPVLHCSRQIWKRHTRLRHRKDADKSGGGINDVKGALARAGNSANGGASPALEPHPANHLSPWKTSCVQGPGSSACWTAQDGSKSDEKLRSGFCNQAFLQNLRWLCEFEWFPRKLLYT